MGDSRVSRRAEYEKDRQQKKKKEQGPGSGERDPAPRARAFRAAKAACRDTLPARSGRRRRRWPTIRPALRLWSEGDHLAQPLAELGDLGV